MSSMRSAIENTVPIRFLDEANDARLLAIAAERMSHFDPATVISQEQVDQEFPS